MRSAAAPLILVAARLRRRPGRFGLPVLGIALAAAFACAVAAESVIAGDRGARSVLTALDLSQRSVRVGWDGPAGAGVDGRARALLRDLGLPVPTRVVLLSPVRLDGVVVRPAAISPLAPWVGDPGEHGSGRADRPGLSPGALGACRPRDCPVLEAGGVVNRRILSAPGVTLRIIGTGALRSAAPLGFAPSGGRGMPLLLTPDVTGLDSLPALSSLYRSQGWLAPLDVGRLQSWELEATEGRLQRAQAALATSNGGFSLNAPFAALDAARAEAAAAPSRLLAAGGGALAALAVFVILAAYGLRRDQAAELERLRIAGARAGQRLTFALGEAAILSATGLVGGAAVGIGAGALLAHAAGLPAAGVLGHSLVMWRGAAALGGGWLVATAVVGTVLVAPDGHLIDALALAGAAAVALALTRGGGSDGALALLLAPLTCLAGGVLVYRLAATLLSGGERLIRHGPLPVRLAFSGLARAPAAPALAIAVVAVSTGLGGFALAYRATLERATADQAADRVPLDATITQTASFVTPLELASPARWRALAAGPVLPVLRTQATFAGPGAAVTVPALGVPASGLGLIHGWRAGDGPTSLAKLGRRLAPRGPVRVPGPMLPAGSRTLSLRLRTSGDPVQVTAELRGAGGAVTPVSLGGASARARARARTATARLPAGRHELEALELDVSAGQEATAGHQNAENPAARTQFSTTVSLGPAVARDSRGDRLSVTGLGGWRGVGAATAARPADRGGAVRVRFAESGQPGVVRPVQPSDRGAIAVLADPATAAAASGARSGGGGTGGGRSGGLIALTIDGLPVQARIVGVVRRFPTLAPDDAGFIVADEATLAAALDASLPGQGRSDELWIDTGEPRRLDAALTAPPLDRLGHSFRYQVQRALRSEPLATGTLGTLAAAAGLGVALALVGLLAALAGPLRDPAVERDLSVLGLGPRARRRELRVRIGLAGTCGVAAGAVLALGLTGLAVSAVRAGATLETPRPPLVTVVPSGELALAACALAVGLAVAGGLVTGVMARRERST